MLAGVLAGWRRDANPGALDDMVESPTEYAHNTAAVTLTFADGATFVLTCLCVAEARAGDGELGREGVTS
jgi:hypothetical protein